MRFLYTHGSFIVLCSTTGNMPDDNGYPLHGHEPMSEPPTTSDENVLVEDEDQSLRNDDNQDSSTSSEK